MKKIFFVTALYGLTFAACQKHAAHSREAHEHSDTEHVHSHEGCNHSHDDEETGTAHEEAGDILFHLEQQEKIAFATDLPLFEPFGQVIKTTAQVQYAPMDEALVSARIPGIVRFVENTFSEGQPVHPSQQLFTISGAGLEENNSQVRFAEAQSAYLNAESNYKRAQELITDKIISEKDYLRIKTDYETAQTVYHNLYRNFDKEGQKVFAPLTGYLKQIFVENGQFVEAGQALASISKNKTLRLKADVRSKHAALLPFLVSATFRGTDKTTRSLEELNGKILSVGKSLNEDHSIPVTLQIDNKSGVIPGSFVEVYLKTHSGKPVMTIPSTALTEEQGVHFVYVQITSETFEKREVTLGLTDGIRTEIRSGLNSDERIVTEGAISVRLAQSAGDLDPHAGHVH
jgi:RND family efflux transporter MFP subunit